MRTTRQILRMGLVLALAGCLPSTNLRPPPAVPSPAAPRQVKVSGAGQSLGDVEQAALAPDDFVRKVSDLLSAQRPQTARRLIERYPDVALDVLRGATAAQAGNGALLTVARVHDEQCCRAEHGVSWEAVLK